MSEEVSGRAADGTATCSVMSVLGSGTVLVHYL